MPVLRDNTEKLEKIYLPSTENETEENRAWLVMDTAPLLAIDATSIVEDAKTGGDATLYMLASRIREWNFTEADGTPVPITKESVGRLSMSDFAHLQTLISGKDKHLSEEDQNLSSAPSSQPVKTATTIPVESL